MKTSPLCLCLRFGFLDFLSCFLFSKLRVKLVFCVVLISFCPTVKFPQVYEQQKTPKTTWDVSWKVPALSFLSSVATIRKISPTCTHNLSRLQVPPFQMLISIGFAICGIWHGIGFIVFPALTVGLTNETNFLTAVGASCKFNIMQLFFAESWDAREASKHVPWTGNPVASKEIDARQRGFLVCKPTKLQENLPNKNHQHSQNTCALETAAFANDGNGTTISISVSDWKPSPVVSKASDWWFGVAMSSSPVLMLRRASCEYLQTLGWEVLLYSWAARTEGLQWYRKDVACNCKQTGFRQHSFVDGTCWFWYRRSWTYHAACRGLVSWKDSKGFDSTHSSSRIAQPFIRQSQDHGKTQKHTFVWDRFPSGWDSRGGQWARWWWGTGRISIQFFWHTEDEGRFGSDGAVVPRGRCSSEGCLEACLVLLACTMLGEWCTFADFPRVPTLALSFFFGLSLVKKPMGANPMQDVEVERAAAKSAVPFRSWRWRILSWPDVTSVIYNTGMFCADLEAAVVLWSGTASIPPCRHRVGIPNFIWKCFCFELLDESPSQATLWLYESMRAALKLSHRGATFFYIFSSGWTDYVVSFGNQISNFCSVKDCSCPLTMCPDNLKRLRPTKTWNNSLSKSDTDGAAQGNLHHQATERVPHSANSVLGVCIGLSGSRLL